MSSRYSIATLALLFGIVGPFFSIKYADTPYLWTFLSLFLTCVLAAFSSRKATAKAIWINVGAVAGLLTIVEGYWSITSGRGGEDHVSITYSDQYFVSDDVLGYAPVKDTAVTATKRYKGESLYKVVYTINEHGLRIPPYNATDSTECILFFGGSFTFGEGVNDDETMPYRVGVRSGHKYRIYNFGFHGYGPHQMLAAIEQGLVDQIIQCEPRHIIYTGMLAHVSRSAGLSSWDQHGPKYIVNTEGELVYAGHFDEAPSYRLKRLVRIDESLIYQKIFGMQRKISLRDVSLYVEIISRVHETTRNKYPKSEFSVLIWGYSKDPDLTNIKSQLSDREINVIPRRNIFPSYGQNYSELEISEHDHHPNALAYDLIAQYIVTNVIDSMK